jgi:hypothetical protein
VFKRPSPWIAALTAAALLAPSAAAWAEPPEHDPTSAQYDLLGASRQAASQGDLPRALALLDEALALGRHPMFHLERGALLLDMGRCAEAREALRLAEHHDPWAMPGKDTHMREQAHQLDRLHTTCSATLELTCPEGTTAFIDGQPVPCNPPLPLLPEHHLLTAARADGAPVRLRRIYLEGAERTTLRLDPPDDRDDRHHWTPTSPQRVPEQNPRQAQRDDLFFMGIFLTSLGTLLAGVGGTVLGLTYAEGDPEDHPDPSLTEDEQEQAELDYIAGLSYGWMGTICGLVVMGLGVSFFFTEPTPGDDIPDAQDSALRLLPWSSGQVWGVEGRW